MTTPPLSLRMNEGERGERNEKITGARSLGGMCSYFVKRD